jgi:ferredoxin
MKGAPVKIRIDRIACDGKGLCAELLPELIRLDDWGYPIVEDDQVPAHLLSAARCARELCPKLAFHLETVQATV